MPVDTKIQWCLNKAEKEGEFYQYGTETEVDQEKVIRLQQEAKEFVTKIRTLLQTEET